MRVAADRWSGGRIAAVLEGGYDLDGLAGGATATLDALVADDVAAEALAALPIPGTLARAAIDGTLAAHAAAGCAIPAAETAR